MEDEAAANFLVNFANVMAGNIVAEQNNQPQNDLHQFEENANILQGQEIHQVEDSLGSIHYPSSNAENSNQNSTATMQVQDHSYFLQQNANLQDCSNDGTNSVKSDLEHNGSANQGPQTMKNFDITHPTNVDQFESKSPTQVDSAICDNQTKTNVIQCATCNLSFDTNEQLQNHRLQSHPTVDSRNETPVLMAVENQDKVSLDLAQVGPDILTALVMQDPENENLQTVNQDNNAAEMGNIESVLETEIVGDQEGFSRTQEEPSPRLEPGSIESVEDVCCTFLVFYSILWHYTNFRCLLNVS